MFGLSGISASRVEEASPSLRFIYLLEIFTAWALIEATIWHYGKTQFRLFWISFAFIVASTIAHRPKLSEIGLSVRGLRTSLWVIPSAIAVSSAAMLLAWAAGTLHPLFGAVAQAKHSSGYAIWAVLQQFILQSYFYLRFEKLVSPRSAILLSAGLFCLAHIPNPVLLVTCLIAGCIACEIFRRNRNIYALGVAHAILGLTIAITVPDDIQRHMRVGIGYYHYHKS
ncbi:MAG: CAAX protease family protein [Acidobacteria bacterium]|nr:MAG: CAAX protease family protein [Acidobacteriota bacterium]PYY24804.1 MAG: CAAX protease family protein [Acidobacteriota bacterium]